MRGTRLALAFVLLGGATSWPVDAEPSRSWPQWRGPSGQGVSSETGLPEVWSATHNVLWKTAIPGRGHSSPIVWGDRIFLTTAIEGELVPARPVKHFEGGQEFVHPDGIGADRKHTLKLLSVDAETGKILWERTAWEGTPYDTRHRRGSYASPTAVTDGRHVYAYFGAEGLYCYDFDGKLVWKVSLGGIASFGVGVGTSPVLYRGLVIVLCDEDNGEKSFLAAFDTKTGKQAWRVARKVQLSWATPMIVTADGRDELITSGTELVIAYDPASGKELWCSKGLGNNAIPSPVAGGDIAVVSAGYPEKLAFALRPGGSGDITDSPRVLWKYTKGTAYVPSPILYGDYVYLMTDRGLVTCLDAKTGAVQYEGGRVPVPATFMASPVAYQGKILLFSEDGDTYVIQAGPTHQVLRTNPLGEPIYATPAVANGRVYIRAVGHLYAIGKAAS